MAGKAGLAPRISKGSMAPLPRYDPTQSYDWNYRNAPEPRAVTARPIPGPWQFCGLAVDSPLGVAAGPLLNGKWCLYYAGLGYDVVTYKTVRSSARPCYDLPNLQPVVCEQLRGGEGDLPTSPEMRGSWAVSFGMPSQPPATWRDDVEQTRKSLNPRKRLVVSVVGTAQEERTIDDLANDYAPCARRAANSGADPVECNFS